MCQTQFARPAALDGTTSSELDVAIPMLFATPVIDRRTPFSVPAGVDPSKVSPPPGLLTTAFGPFKYSVLLPLYPATSGSSAPLTCPVTTAPNPPFVPPAPYTSTPYPDNPNIRDFWYGSPDLWTFLPEGGTFAATNGGGNVSFRMIWLSKDFDWQNQSQQPVSISGLRLDGPSAPLKASVNGASSADFHSHMLAGIDVPTAGCWKITGSYNGTTLSLVIRVGPMSTWHADAVEPPSARMAQQRQACGAGRADGRSERERNLHGSDSPDPGMCASPVELERHRSIPLARRPTKLCCRSRANRGSDQRARHRSFVSADGPLPCVRPSRKVPPAADAGWLHPVGRSARCLRLSPRRAGRVRRDLSARLDRPKHLPGHAPVFTNFFTPSAAGSSQPSVVHLWRLLVRHGRSVDRPAAGRRVEQTQPKSLLVVGRLQRERGADPCARGHGIALDGQSTQAQVDTPTNANGQMLVGVDFPTGGCWKGHRRIPEPTVEFVVWVTDGVGQSVQSGARPMPATTPTPGADGLTHTDLECHATSFGPSTATPSDINVEFRGVASSGQFWALLYQQMPIYAGQTAQFAWKIESSDTFSLSIEDAKGTAPDPRLT